MDWTAKGGEGNSNRESEISYQWKRDVAHSKTTVILVSSYLQTQRSAIKMLHERIKVLVDYVAAVVGGKLRTHSTIHGAVVLMNTIDYRERS